MRSQSQVNIFCHFIHGKETSTEGKSLAVRDVRKYKLRIFICWVIQVQDYQQGQKTNKVQPVKWLQFSQQTHGNVSTISKCTSIRQSTTASLFAFSRMTKRTNLIICLLCCICSRNYCWKFWKHTLLINTDPQLIQHLSHSMICANAWVCRKIILEFKKSFLNYITNWKVKASWKHRPVHEHREWFTTPNSPKSWDAV